MAVSFSELDEEDPLFDPCYDADTCMKVTAHPTLHYWVDSRMMRMRITFKEVSKRKIKKQVRVRLKD